MPKPFGKVSFFEVPSPVHSIMHQQLKLKKTLGFKTNKFLFIGLCFRFDEITSSAWSKNRKEIIVKIIILYTNSTLFHILNSWLPYKEFMPILLIFIFFYRTFECTFHYVEKKKSKYFISLME